MNSWSLGLLVLLGVMVMVIEGAPTSTTLTSCDEFLRPDQAHFNGTHCLAKVSGGTAPAEFFKNGSLTCPPNSALLTYSFNYGGGSRSEESGTCGCVSGYDESEDGKDCERLGSWGESCSGSGSHPDGLKVTGRCDAGHGLTCSASTGSCACGDSDGVWVPSLTNSQCYSQAYCSRLNSTRVTFDPEVGKCVVGLGDDCGYFSILSGRSYYWRENFDCPLNAQCSKGQGSICVCGEGYEEDSSRTRCILKS